MVMKTSLACLLLVTYMGVFYFSNKHLPLKSSKFFSYYYTSAVILMVFDFITVYTVNHIDRVPDMVNSTVHAIYLVTINIALYLYFLYLRSLLESKITILATIRVLQAVPFFVTSILILILPIWYVEGNTTNYSMGPKVYALYVSVVLYNILILYYCIRYWNLLGKQKRMAILVSVPLFILVSVVNMVMPEGLFTIVYVTLNTVGLILSNENSERYLDQETGMFNQYAMDVVVDEEIALKRNEFLVVMTLSESENARHAIDRQQYLNVMEQIRRYCKKERGPEAYRVGDNGFVFFTHSRQLAEQVAVVVKKYVQDQCRCEVCLEDKIIALNECSSGKEIMSNIVKICTNAMNKMAVYDFMTGVRNRNSFDLELAQMKKDGVDAYYFFADLNNLKVANDSMGHSAGDELIRALAKVLKDTAGKNGTVFRYGGDEFTVLWNGKDANQFLEALEKNCEQLNENRIIPVSFAIGYGKILEEDGILKADKMMYENKARMKASQKERPQTS